MITNRAWFDPPTSYVLRIAVTARLLVAEDIFPSKLK